MVPVSDCPLSREKMAAAAAIDIEGRSSRATLLGGEGRERERERGPSVPKQGNFRGGGERREARRTKRGLAAGRTGEEENRERRRRRRRWGRRVARTTISVAVAAATATATAIVVYIPPTTGIERRSRWQ